MAQIKAKLEASGLDRIGAIAIIVIGVAALVMNIVSYSALASMDTEAALAGLNATMTRSWNTQYAADLNNAQTGIIMGILLAASGVLNFIVKGRRTVGSTALAVSLIALMIRFSGFYAVMMVIAVAASVLMMVAEGRLREEAV